MVARSYSDTITAAINDMAEHGFTSIERLNYWLDQIKQAAERAMTPPDEMERMFHETLSSIFRKMVDEGGLLRYHPGVQRYTIDRVKPALRAELDRRIMASAKLIRLNREEMIQKTLRRFSGWSTSIPAGGTEDFKRAKLKESIKGPMQSLPFEERRVLTDQGHKFKSSLSETVAFGNNAIAGIWHSHWRTAGYNYREDHKERDLLIFAVPGNWAYEKGLMKPGPAGWYDEKIDHVGEKVFCRCYMQWIYNVRSLPPYMLTRKGEEELRRVAVSV